MANKALEIARRGIKGAKKAGKAAMSLPKRAVDRAIRVNSDPNVKGGIAHMIATFKEQRKQDAAIRSMRRR